MPKPIEADKLTDVKKHFKGHFIIRWSKNDSGDITILLSDGKVYKVKNVRAENYRSHVLLRDSFNGHLHIPLSAAQVKSRWWNSMRWSIAGLTVSLLLGLSSN